MEALDHPNILSLKEFYKTQSNNLVLILEYCQNGDLEELIEGGNGEHFEEDLVTSKMIRVDRTAVPCIAILSQSEHFTWGCKVIQRVSNRPKELEIR